MPSVLVPLSAYFTSLKGQPTGLEFIDPTSIKVCHNLRIPRHKVFDNVAQRRKGTMGWFYGFKFHIIINHLGDIVAAKLTTGNTDDGITLVTTQKKNMKRKLLSAWDRAMLSRRFIIETINDQLKNISQIEHS